MKKQLTFIITLLGALCVAGLRFWNLTVAVDSQGLPVRHISVYLLVGVSAAFLIAFLVLSRVCPGRSGRHAVLTYGPVGGVLGILAGALILIGSGVEFAEALTSGPSITAPIMCLLGLFGGVCCIAVSALRRRGDNLHPVPELIPPIYLVVKLIINFKSWSIDPIILDYCIVLFALIFTLLAFYRGGGFVFDQGKPRKTLFYAMAAVYFCAGALVDGVVDLSFSTIIIYAGYLLWQLPVMSCLLVPSEPDPVPAPVEKKSKSV